MKITAADRFFAGSIPAVYQEYLVPLIFEAYAVDLAARLASLHLERVLELAAGTGVLTRQMASTLPAPASITATDLNPQMLAIAEQTPIDRDVDWQAADALLLPFEEGSFDAVVCQFGVMFFPDKPRAFAEARRVLRPGGLLLFNAWDRIEENEFAHCVVEALAALYADDPPRFMARIPHGYWRQDVIAQDLAAGGFDSPAQFDTLARSSRAASARTAAIAYCQGTPMRSEIEARSPGGLDAATDAVSAAIVRRFGGGVIEGKIQAHIVSVTR
jgi:SAM-dependent methyltransferase